MGFVCLDQRHASTHTWEHLDTLHQNCKCLVKFQQIQAQGGYVFLMVITAIIMFRTNVPGPAILLTLNQANYSRGLGAR